MSIESISLKFRSGNSVPVNEARVTSAEWRNVNAEIARLRAEIAELKALQEDSTNQILALQNVELRAEIEWLSDRFTFTDEQITSVARAFWRRIQPYVYAENRAPYPRELGEKIPVEFQAHMGTALLALHLHRKPKDINALKEARDDG